MRQYRSRGLICGLIALALFTGVLSLTDQAQAQTSANGPYYATPSWDQTLPAATRFIVLSNFNDEAVLDRNTGLVWERSNSTATGGSWAEARFQCLNKIVGQQRGWRLPSVTELMSLIDPIQVPALPKGHPFTVQLTIYWSATTNADSPANAWAVGLNRGLALFESKANFVAAWCVRGSNNADQY